jgi:hypothetical protein
MEVSGELHAPAPLSFRKEPIIPVAGLDVTVKRKEKKRKEYLN